jgi:hypothetical protein
LEKILVAHVGSEFVLVAGVYLVPIQTVFLMFVIVETVLGVDDIPQRFEIALWSIVGYIFGDARGTPRDDGQQ